MRYNNVFSNLKLLLLKDQILTEQIRALQALQKSHEKKESQLKIYGGVIQSNEAGNRSFI